MDPEARETQGKHPGHHLMARVVARTTEYFVWDLRLPTHPQCISTAFKYMRLELRPSSFKSASEFTMALLLLFCGHCVFSQSNADKWLLSCLLRFSPQQPPACLSSLGCPPVLWAQLPPPPRSPHCDQPPSVQVPRTLGVRCPASPWPNLVQATTSPSCSCCSLCPGVQRHPIPASHLPTAPAGACEAPLCPLALRALLPCTPCALPLPRSLCMCCFPQPGARAPPPVPSALTISLTLELSASSRKPVLGP